MYRYTFALIGASLVVLLGLVPTHPAFADSTFQAGQSVVVVGTEGRGLKVRGGPGISHRVVTTVPEGSTVQVISGPVADGGDDWYQVSVGTSTTGTTGWAVATYLLPTSAVRSLSTDDGPRTFLGKVTAYSNGVGGIRIGAKTSSGTKTRWGVVAVDPKVIPIGSTLLIGGYDDVIFVAEDVGSGIKGEAIDIWLPDAAEARRYGTQYRKITILHEGPAVPGTAPRVPSASDLGL